MKEAYAKCSAPPAEETPNPPHIPSILLGKLPPGFAIDPDTQTITKPLDGTILNDKDQEQPQTPRPSLTGLPFNFRPQAVS
jgi:hypothetical protein